jgi:hypothetical protein
VTKIKSLKEKSNLSGFISDNRILFALLIRTANAIVGITIFGHFSHIINITAIEYNPVFQ